MEATPDVEEIIVQAIPWISCTPCAEPFMKTCKSTLAVDSLPSAPGNSFLFHRAFMAMALGNFFVGSSFNSFAIFPLFVGEHGGNRVDVGILMGAVMFSSVACRPWISSMIDRMGRKRGFAIGALIMSVLPLVYLLFRGDLSSFFWLLLPVRLLHGIGLALCITAAFTYAGDIIPEGRLNEGIGIFGISGLIGMALGPVIGELVSVHLGFSAFFLVAAGLGTVGFLAHLSVPESYVRKPVRESVSFLSVLRKDRVLSVALVGFLFGVGLAAASSFVAPFAYEAGLSPVSSYYVAYSFAAILTRIVGGRFSDRVGESRIIPMALGLTGGGLLLLAFLSGSPTLIVSGLLTGCGHGFLFPSLNALAIRDEPGEVRGRITGVFTGSIDAGVFLGSVALGYVGQWAGFRSLFLAAGAAVLSGLAVFRLRNGGLKPSPSSWR